MSRRSGGVANLLLVLPSVESPSIAEILCAILYPTHIHHTALRKEKTESRGPARRVSGRQQPRTPCCPCRRAGTLMRYRWGLSAPSPLALNNRSVEPRWSSIVQIELEAGCCAHSPSTDEPALLPACSCRRLSYSFPHYELQKNLAS